MKIGNILILTHLKAEKRLRKSSKCVDHKKVLINVLSAIALPKLKTTGHAFDYCLRYFRFRACLSFLECIFNASQDRNIKKGTPVQQARFARVLDTRDEKIIFESFSLLLKRASFFEAYGAVEQFDSSLKPNHHAEL
jgi:hypothetical protein